MSADHPGRAAKHWSPDTQPHHDTATWIAGGGRVGLDYGGLTAVP